MLEQVARPGVQPIWAAQARKASPNPTGGTQPRKTAAAQSPWRFSCKSLSPSLRYPRNGAYQDLGTFGGTYSEPSGIDELGRVAGYAYQAFPQHAIHAFRSTTSGTLVDIDGAGGLGGDYSLGNAINSSGHVVGEAYGADGKYHAFYWPGSGPMQDLGFFASTQGKAVDISDNGIILGIGGGSFLWQRGVSTLISTAEHPGIRGVAVNNAGQVVGQSINDQGFGVPVTWHAVDGAANLNDLLEPATGAGWTLFYVNDVNNAGQIVGQGIHNGELRAFLMTPIPEPSALVLLASGATAVVAQRRRRSPRPGHGA